MLAVQLHSHQAITVFLRWQVQDWCKPCQKFAYTIFTIIGWIAGAVVGGLIDSLVQPSQPQQPTAYFHCNNCQHNFN
jgi:hypothetical protein